MGASSKRARVAGAAILDAARTGVDAVLPLGPEGPEPLCAWYAPSCLAVAERLLAGGERRARALAEAVHAVIRTAVIDRGGDAMPPRELLPLRLPEVPADEPVQAAEPEEPGAPQLADLNPFERGPEITEVR